MKTLSVFMLAVAAVVLGGCSSGESFVKAGYDFSKINNVAVIDVSGDLDNEGEKNQIADFLNMEMLRKGYSPVERGRIQTLLKEQEFQASELTTPDGAARAGKILNVPAALSISIPRFGEKMSMTIKMTDVESGEIVFMGSGEANTQRTLGTVLGAVGGAVAGVAVSGEDHRVLGGIAGGVGGAFLGRALTPEKQKMVKKAMAKACKELPTRLPAK